MPFSLPFVNVWGGCECVCVCVERGGGEGTVEEGAHERSCVLITAFWKLTISMMMNLQIITKKTWNVAAARPVNRSSNQPLCLTYWGARVDLWSSGLLLPIALKVIWIYFLTHASLKSCLLFDWFREQSKWSDPCVLIGYPGGKVGPSFPIGISRSRPTWKRFLGHIINLLLTKIVRLR